MSRTRVQSWYGSTDVIVQYGLFGNDGDGRHTRPYVEHAARILAEATGGLVLDEDGFPWPER